MSGFSGTATPCKKRVLNPLFLFLALIVLQPEIASSNDAIISSYSPDEDCTIVEATDAIVDYRCPGVFDVDVWFSISDARWHISFHKERPTGLVMKQGFNRAHHPDLQVEWRFDGNRPMAALQLWRFYDGAGEMDDGAWLITKIDGDTICHMGFVDRLENEEPLAIARQFADANALSFSCADDPAWIGNPSRIEGHTHQTAP